MTTIAYRDGVVAADSQETDGGGQITTCQKLFKVGDTIIATAGASFTGLIYVDWYKRGARMEDAPDLSNLDIDEDFECLVLEDTDRIYTVNRLFQKYYIDMPEGFYAIGWGSPYATAAMHMGADAKQAVRVACKYDAYTGGRVRTTKVKEAS